MKYKYLIVFLMVWSINVSAQKKFEDIKSYPIDYSDMKNWAAHPWKKDPSDSIPSELVSANVNDTLVDVFFIHPTTLTSKKNLSWNASLDDEALNEKTDKSTILYQASVFNENTRVFAPRYRQAHIRAFYSDDSNVSAAFEMAYQDIKEAFSYYLQKYNNNRPIIIASHSQGTKHAGRLLKEFFENQPLEKKLVCAYIIGMPVPDNYFSTLKPCSDKDQTGCFVSWRTYKKGYTPEFVKKEVFNSVVVNPLSWKITKEKVSKKMNKGGILLNFNKIKKEVVDAEVHGNILWSCKPDIRGKFFIRKKNFHIGDINLFYMNIRENVQNRVDHFLNKTTGL